MQLVAAGIENHPAGSGNLNPIINGNWNAINSWFNPAQDYTASQSGTTVTASSAVFSSFDVGATVRFADGTTDTIATYVGPTQVTVGVSRTVGSQAFELYRSGESLRGTLLRGLLAVQQIDATTHGGRFLYVDSTTEKLKPSSTLDYAGGVYTFTEPVVIDDDDGAASTEAMLTIRRNMDATSGYNWAFVVAATVENTTASTANPSAGYFTINTTNATANITTAGGGRPGVCGLYVNPGHGNTTYTLDMLQGMFIYVSHGSGAANLAEMNGIQIYMDCAAASTTDLVRALYIPTIQRAGGADAWWAIYTAGTADKSYLAGKLILSDSDTAVDDTFSTDRLSLHAEGAYGATNKAAFDCDNENTLSTGTSSAVTVAAMIKSRFTGSVYMVGADGLVAGYFWTRNISTSVSTSTAYIVGIYARAEVASGAGAGGTTHLAAIRCRFENAKSGHTVTNGYGLLILASIQTGTITNPWAIYQSGATDHNYFAGNVHLGTTAKPSSLVSGLVMATGTAATGTVSAGDVAIWFDGSNLRMRIGTTDYTVTKT